MRPGLIARLRERGVLRVAASYAVIAWLLLQIADVTFDPLGVPKWIMPAIRRNCSAARQAVAAFFLRVVRGFFSVGSAAAFFAAFFGAAFSAGAAFFLRARGFFPPSSDVSAAADADSTSAINAIGAESPGRFAMCRMRV